ncbi:MAG TPA: Na/Pi cotransporter family protein [Xanthobacteraceae bacterium]|nr:Na/Pi cotransporter family protein [Xanthobacteraceae bacterium]
MTSSVLLDLLGGVSLLIWGLHMVRSGIVRAFGSDLRRLLGAALRNRVRAFLAGLGVTAVLQSSTATALMIASFAAGGLVDLVPALAVMLGANVGTALIVQVLSFDVSALAPLFLVAGVVAFRRGGRTRTRDLGRVAVGLGLMLLALHILLDSLAPAEQAPQMRALLAILQGQPAVCILIGALLAWAAHSSVAVILLVMSLAFSNFVTPLAALALVLGANLGSAINPLFEGGSFDDPASRRVPVGNLLNRVVGVALAYPFLGVLADMLPRLEPNASRMVAEAHLAFNLLLAFAFIGPLGAVAWLLTRALPDRKAKPSPGAPLYLDETAFATPSVALACAARETLHMGDIVETMLRQAMTALMTDDRKLVADICRTDNAVDRLDEAIKLYVTKITRESLDEVDGRRAMEIIAFTINLEHIGDIIDKNLMELAVKKIKHKYQFSKEGAAELAAFHQRVVENLKLAFGVFMSGDVKVARKLIEEKAQLRSAELAAAESHLARLREGRPESIETTSLHLDVLRDLKRIHSHICSVAYPVLEAAGELEPSRLRHAESTAANLLAGGGTAASEPAQSNL